MGSMDSQCKRGQRGRQWTLPPALKRLILCKISLEQRKIWCGWLVAALCVTAGLLKSLIHYKFLFIMAIFSYVWMGVGNFVKMLFSVQFNFFFYLIVQPWIFGVVVGVGVIFYGNHEHETPWKTHMMTFCYFIHFPYVNSFGSQFIEK